MLTCTENRLTILLLFVNLNTDMSPRDTLRVKRDETGGFMTEAVVEKCQTKNSQEMSRNGEQMEHKSRIYKMAVCSLFTALTAVGAFIKIPVPVVPFTLQVLFILLAGLLLGGRLGAVSVTAYALLGLAGLPIFAEGGGFWYVLKPSFGYILGFILAAYVTGRMTEKMEGLPFGKVLAVCLIGLAIVYGVGMVYYYIICNYVIETPIGLWPLFLYCFLLVVPGDICLCFAAAVLTKRIKPVIARM